MTRIRITRSKPYGTLDNMLAWLRANSGNNTFDWNMTDSEYIFDINDPHIATMFKIVWA